MLHNVHKKQDMAKINKKVTNIEKLEQKKLFFSVRLWPEPWTPLIQVFWKVC